MQSALYFTKLIISYATKIRNISCSSKTLKYLKAPNNMFKSSLLNLQKDSKHQVQEYLHSFDTVLTDCDGVLWCLCHDNAIPGSAETLEYFRKLGKKIYYVTNNSTRTRSEIVEKAKQLGFTPDLMTEDDYHSFKPELDKQVGAGVVGFDEHISYPKLTKAASYLASEECLFIGTNCDAKVFKSSSTVIPAAGTMIKAVEFCSGREANILDKPNSYIRKYIESYGLNPAWTLMIGDNCDTDVEFGVRCGFQTLLVLTGITSAADIEKMRTEKISTLPDAVLPKLGDVLDLI